MKNLFRSAFLLAAIASAPVSSAQIAVIDGANLAQQVETVRNSLQQIPDDQRLYNAANNVTDIASIGSVLNNQSVRTGLPTELQTIGNIASTDLSNLGAVGQRATDILVQRNLAATETNQFYAKRQTMGETGVSSALETDQGIQELKQRLATAESAKEPADLNARATMEVAQLLNQANARTNLEAADRAAKSLAQAEYYQKQKEPLAHRIANGTIVPKWEKFQ